ncbi:olfactory receptor 14I1 [Acanthopagrus latus]|uniref:olfactory receptor 14I1 n=1 Tax=Acanthopagrus latus TaxID=8177 RepID=UPI00187C134A|nr:olfactory receptor 14I1 [Acanthopagrus latus]
MPATNVMITVEHNLTAQCDWLSEENRTDLRVTGQFDAARCLFISILPFGQAVPAATCIFVLLALFSLLVNGFTLFGLGRSDDLSWEPRVVFFRNLILSDLVQTVTFAPSVIHALVQRRTVAFGLWCRVQYLVGTASIFSSLCTITCMALERYIYVCHAIRYLVIFTQVRLRLALTLIWVYAISPATITTALLHSEVERTSEPFIRGLLCEPDMVEQHMGFPRVPAVFRKVFGLATLLLCVLVYIFSYFRMYQDARSATIPFNVVNTAARKTVLFYCGMLLLQLLPLLLKVASDALWEFEGAATPATVTVFHISLALTLLVPPCVNPLVYGLRNAEMRQALLSPFQRWTERRRTDV